MGSKWMIVGFNAFCYDDIFRALLQGDHLLFNVHYRHQMVAAVGYEVLTTELYSCSLSSGSDVVHLFAKCSAYNRTRQGKLRTPARSHAHKNKECVHALKSCICVLASLPEDGEQEYKTMMIQFHKHSKCHITCHLIIQVEHTLWYCTRE